MFQLSVRLPTYLVEQADELAALLSRPGLDLKRADAIRAAVARGLEIMLAEERPVGRSRKKK